MSYTGYRCNIFNSILWIPFLFTTLLFYVSVNGTVRLEDEEWPYNFGPFQVYHNSMWNYVCLDDWNDIATSLVCRSLGFKTQGSMVVHNIDPGNEFLRYEVQCNGNETEFAQCIDYSQSRTGCTHSSVLLCSLHGRKGLIPSHNMLQICRLMSV